MASSFQGDVVPDREDYPSDGGRGGRGGAILTALKLIAAAALFYSAGTSFAETRRANNDRRHGGGRASPASLAGASPAELGMSAPSKYGYLSPPDAAGSRPGGVHGRRLSDAKRNPPSYMKDLMDDLKARKKLMEETPPEEVKYWFEYTGPLQVSAMLI